MTPGTVFLLDLTAAQPEAWSLAPRCGARFFLAFSGETSRVYSISSWVDSLVMPGMVFIGCDIMILLKGAVLFRPGCVSLRNRLCGVALFTPLGATPPPGSSTALPGRKIPRS